MVKVTSNCNQKIDIFSPSCKQGSYSTTTGVTYQVYQISLKTIFYYRYSPIH